MESQDNNLPYRATKKLIKKANEVYMDITDFIRLGYHSEIAMLDVHTYPTYIQLLYPVAHGDRRGLSIELSDLMQTETA